MIAPYINLAPYIAADAVAEKPPPIYDEICLLWEDFAAISISHCNRECNSVARELARQAMLDKISQVWIDDPPPSSIRHLLVNDVTIFSIQ
jgi:hypothetical protein